MSPQRTTELIDAARKLGAALGDDEAVLIGGMCANVLGVERLTRDVDFAIDATPASVVERLHRAGIVGRLDIGGAHDSLPWAVRGEVDGIPFRVLPLASVAAAAQTTKVAALGLRVLTPLGFAAAKCRAGSWRDIYDVAWLTMAYPHLREPVAELARRHNVDQRLARALADERLRSRDRFPEPGDEP